MHIRFNLNISIRIITLSAAMAITCANAKQQKPVAFKDAHKIKTWDAWNDKSK